MARTTERTTPLTEMNFRGMDLNSTTASVTVYPSDSGVMFVNAYSSGAATYTLPAVADCAGKMWIFYVAHGSASFIITLDAADDDKIKVNDSIVADYVTSDSVVGSWCWVVSDGSYFYCMAVGTWTKTDS